MSGAIKPALTPEEWASYPNWPGLVGASGEERPLYFPTRHGIAAANLHGQPFGFTKEDVSLLADRISSDVDDGEGREYLCVWLTREESQRLDSLIVRIAALLPPEAR